MHSPNALRRILHAAGCLWVALRRGLAPRERPQPAFRGLPTLRLKEEREVVCTLCQACAEACPQSCIRVRELQGTAQLELDWTTCICCGICAAACPVEAIELSPELVVYCAQNHSESGP
jgi:formate hydrogenlyase subunit 6/NADH:ubiquinone oxidoreductase subunit I